jgi:hypothetical protein
LLPYYFHFSICHFYGSWPICVSLRLFHCTLYKQIVFDHALMRKGSVGSKILSCGMVHQGIPRRVLRGATYDPPLNLLFL